MYLPIPAQASPATSCNMLSRIPFCSHTSKLQCFWSTLHEINIHMCYSFQVHFNQGCCHSIQITDRTTQTLMWCRKYYQYYYFIWMFNPACKIVFHVWMKRVQGAVILPLGNLSIINIKEMKFACFDKLLKEFWNRLGKSTVAQMEKNVIL